MKAKTPFTTYALTSLMVLLGIGVLFSAPMQAQASWGAAAAIEEIYEMVSSGASWDEVFAFIDAVNEIINDPEPAWESVGVASEPEPAPAPEPAPEPEPAYEPPPSEPAPVNSITVQDPSGDSPYTSAVIQNALNAGATPQQAAQAGVDYANSIGLHPTYQTVAGGGVEFVWGPECNNDTMCIGNCEPPPKSCEELGTCPSKSCEELGTCPSKSCAELGNCPPPPPPAVPPAAPPASPPGQQPENGGDDGGPGGPPPNSSPSATPSAPTTGDYCGASSPPIFLSWQFSDPNGDSQSSYRVQVDNNPGFSSPEADSGQVSSSSSQYSPPGLPYDVAFNWRVMVWDSQGASSSWSNGSDFTTARHQYPTSNFTWNPVTPGELQTTQFTDTSQVYGGAAKSAWSWTFQQGAPASSTQQNSQTQFTPIGLKQVTLRLTDSDGYSCQISKNVNVQLPFPDWQEISPF